MNNIQYLHSEYKILIIDTTYNVQFRKGGHEYPVDKFEPKNLEHRKRLAKEIKKYPTSQLEEYFKHNITDWWDICIYAGN